MSVRTIDTVEMTPELARGATGSLLDALAVRAGDIPRCEGESDESVRDRLMMLIEAASTASERDPDRDLPPIVGVATDDQGPAFHEDAPGSAQPDEVGLRDHLAASALQGLLSSRAAHHHPLSVDPQPYADVAYALADAMLAVRRARERAA